MKTLNGQIGGDQKGGVFQQPVKDHEVDIGGKVWFDDYLFHDGSMDPRGIDSLIDKWEELGFEQFEVLGAITKWKEFCVVEYAWGPEIDCDWLELYERGTIAFLKGTEPGEVVGPNSFPLRKRLLPRDRAALFYQLPKVGNFEYAYHDLQPQLHLLRGTVSSKWGCFYFSLIEVGTDRRYEIKLRPKRGEWNWKQQLRGQIWLKDHPKSEVPFNPSIAIFVVLAFLATLAAVKF